MRWWRTRRAKLVDENLELKRQVAELGADKAKLILELDAARAFAAPHWPALTSDEKYWRRRSTQDRRNCLIMADALAAAEGRRGGYRLLLDPAAVERIRAAVRVVLAELAAEKAGQR